MGQAEALARGLGSLADPLREPVLVAIPVFIVFVAIEWISARVLEAREPGGYERRDAVASLLMGASSQAFWLAGKLVGLALYAGPPLRHFPVRGAPAPLRPDRLGYAFGPPGWRPGARPARVASPAPESGRAPAGSASGVPEPH